MENLIRFRYSFRSISMLAFLAILPNFFGMINLPTVWGFKIHIFQYLVFLAAFMYGPLGGLVSGGVGSLFTAISMGNPYIIVGNIILGFCAGLFFRMRWHAMLCILAAYLIQMPWLYYSDIYLAGMPVKVVHGVIIALFFSDILWGWLAWLTYKKTGTIR